MGFSLARCCNTVYRKSRRSYMIDLRRSVQSQSLSTVVTSLIRKTTTCNPGEGHCPSSKEFSNIPSHWMPSNLRMTTMRRSILPTAITSQSTPMTRSADISSLVRRRMILTMTPSRTTSSFKPIRSMSTVAKAHSSPETNSAGQAFMRLPLRRNLLSHQILRVRIWSRRRRSRKGLSLS